MSSRKYDKELKPWSVVHAQLKEDDEGGLDLGQVLAAIRRRLLIIVGIATTVTAASAIAALTNQPTYKAKFEILTEPVTVAVDLLQTQFLDEYPIAFLPRNILSRLEQLNPIQI